MCHKCDIAIHHSKFKFTTTTKMSSRAQGSSSSSSSGVSTLAIVAAVTATAAVAAAVIYFITSSEPQKKKSAAPTKPKQVFKADEKSAIAAASAAALSSTVGPTPIPRDNLLLILSETLKHLKSVADQLKTFGEKIKEELSTSQQPVPAFAIQLRLYQELGAALNEINSQLFAAAQVTEDEVKVSSMMLADDKDITEVVIQINEIITSFEPSPVIPEHVTGEVTLEIFSELMEKMSSAIENAHTEVSKAHSKGTPEFEAALKEQYTEKSKAAETEVFEKHKITNVSGYSCYCLCLSLFFM